MQTKLAEKKEDLKRFMVMKMTDVVLSFQFDTEEEAKLKASELTKQGNGQFVVYEMRAHYERKQVETMVRTELR